MRSPTRPARHTFLTRLQAHSSWAMLALAGMPGCLAALEPALAAASPGQTAPGQTALSQAVPSQAVPTTVAAADAAPLSPSDLVRFAADAVNYDSNGEIMTATGNVVMRRDAQSLRADKVVWNRTTGAITATGNIRTVDQDGNVLYTDHIDLTDTFKAGATQDLLLVLREG
ncbi:MAG: LptA/OstA family protein, partial [Acidocella sp.]|nr:LptA/OstA family protein [Acidocella sp.]